MSSGIEIRKTRPGHVWITLPATKHCREQVRPCSVAELARELDVTTQTVLRWARGDRIPRPVQLALRALMFGEILHDQWQGWRVDEDGRLWAPNGPGSRTGFLAAEIEWWTHVFETNRLLWRRLRDLGDVSVGQEAPADARAAWFQGAHGQRAAAAG